MNLNSFQGGNYSSGVSFKAKMTPNMIEAIKEELETKTGKDRDIALRQILYIKKTKPQWILACKSGYHVKLFDEKRETLEEDFKQAHNGNSIITTAYNCLKRIVEEEKAERAYFEKQNRRFHR